MSVADSIRTKLESALDPVLLNVVDDSHRHAGHAGADPRGESHFNVEIVSAAFVGVGRVQRQRMVYDLLRDELAERVHALSVIARAPDES